MNNLLSVLGLILFVNISALAATVNDNIVKSTKLFHSTAHSTTTYHVSGVDDGTYDILISPNEFDQLSHLSVSLKESGEQLPYTWLNGDSYVQPYNFKRLAVQLPPNTPQLTLVLSISLNNPSTPLPSQLTQDDLAYSLSFKTYTHVVTPYHTNEMRVKVRAPTSKIHRYGMTHDDSKTTKNGGSMVYGPWMDVAPYSIPTDHIEILYEAAGPRLKYEVSERSAQVSHWGNVVSFRDDIVVRNNGPSLKGQFTRLTHQAQTFLNVLPTNIATMLSVRLPALSEEVFFVDQIGNVTTSHYKQGDGHSSHSLLQLKPRYPLMGGWKYSFSIGWENSLRFAAKLARDGTTRLSIPFSSTPENVAVDRHTTRIILPEGAQVHSVYVPFEVDVQYETTTSYLDTIGRNTVVLSKHNTSDAHNGDVTIVYSLSLFNALRKPLAVAAVAFALFSAATLLRRINTRI
ncbi:hypothetical protein E3P98_03624 [Wallemia ichthyophaga]|nr:hypothetical protein E3P98_03624 [Wallemia ichthyophaga]